MPYLFRVKSLEEEIEKLTGQLNEKKEQIATWEKSIETMKTKNNELREKNWKAMDAMSSAEKQHKVEIGKAVASVKVNLTIATTLTCFVDLFEKQSCIIFKQKARLKSIHLSRVTVYSPIINPG